VCAGEPKVIDTPTLETAPLTPETLKVTFSGVPAVGWHWPVLSGIGPTPEPLKVAAGAEASTELLMLASVVFNCAPNHKTVIAKNNIAMAEKSERRVSVFFVMFIFPPLSILRDT
jgi:hypothetical protein